jgi:hypothetical protein
MPDQILLERVVDPLLECLDETFNETHGNYLDKNTSLFPTLDGVSAIEASRAAAINGATIAAHVEHVRFYLDVLNEIMQTKQLVKINWREIWETVKGVTPEGWDNQKRRLRESYQRLMTTISSFKNWDGEYDIAGLISILAHTAYHLGAIRQALAVIRST